MQASELINRAYVLSGITARDLDTVSGSEGADGLFWLNQLLDELSTTSRFIPYIEHPVVNTVAQQEKYFIPNLVRLDVMAFNLDTIRFQMLERSETMYWGLPRVDNIYSLPYTYYAERVNGGMDIYLYFVPDKVYQLHITGRFSVQDVTPSTELDLSYAKFFQSYLMYELASRLCDWFKISLPPPTEKQLLAFRDQLVNLNPLDFSVSKISTLNKLSPFNYGQVNIGKGYVTP